MKILFVASECTPFAKVGGLGDVISALPQALEAQGEEVSVILPLYKNLKDSSSEIIQIDGSPNFVVHFEGADEICQLHRMHFQTGDVWLYLILNEKYLSNGGIYLSDDAMAVGNDEPRRFMFFCQAVHTLLTKGVLQSEIIHCHDWHTSFLLKLLHDQPLGNAAKSILSVHNLGNKGLVTDSLLNHEIDGTDAPHELMGIGVTYADAVVPVSKNYAQELLAGEFCFGLEKVVDENSDKITGVTNGIDVEYYDPNNDPFIAHTYSIPSWEEGKLHAKTELFKKEKWEDADPATTMLFGFVGRVAEQKNIELVVETIKQHANLNMRFIFLGVGDPKLTQMLHELSLKHNNRVKFINRFDEGYSRLIYAGSDAFLVPSLYEPCGLTQMIAMRYGSLPIGRMVGGLVDTIDDREGSQSGFLFEQSTVNEFDDVLSYVYEEWHGNREYWNEMVVNAMKRDFSWTVPAREYREIYQKLLN